MRYPNTIFPKARTMVNPELITVSKEMQNFNHACLSMPCQNKCEVSSPHTITVRYQDPNQGMEFIILTLADIDAVVLWHELTHILDGKTYIDITLESLATNDINHIQDMIMKEQQRRLINEKVIPQLPELEFQITVSKDNAGISRLNKTELSKVLPQMTDSVLSGFLNRCQLVMPKWIQPEERNILYSRL